VASRGLLQLPKTLGDESLLMNAYAVDDAEAHLAGEDEEMRRRFDAPRPATLEETRAAMVRWIEGRRLGGPMFAYAVRQVSTGVLMGGCEARRPAEDVIEVSYWLYPAFRGQGNATRALSLLSEAAGRIAGVRRIEAHISLDNLPSRKLAERAGFVDVGEVEETAWTGATSTMIRYARLIGPP